MTLHQVLKNSSRSAEREVPALEYANPQIEKPSRSIYRIALVLGVAPMVLGGLALLIFWAMRWGWGADYTTALVMISVVMIFAAMVQLLVFGFREWRYQRLSRGGWQLRFYLGVLLLACNVPTVALYTIAPHKLTRRTTVTVINNGPGMIDRFVVKSTGINSDIGPVAPGATLMGTFDVPMTTWLSYEVWQTRGNSSSMGGGSLPRAASHTFTMTNAGMTRK